MNRLRFLFFITGLSFFVLSFSAIENSNDYWGYHHNVIKAEELIVQEKFQDALVVYFEIFEAYDFVFLRDYQIATQLATMTNQTSLAIKYLKLAIESGWTVAKVKKNKFTSSLLNQIKESEIRTLTSKYNQKIDESLRNEVLNLYKLDQKMALKALFKIGRTSKIKYAERKFAPHSEIQLLKVISILDTYGYPGERIVGNNSWVSTILSHHNSISPKYNKQDTLFNYIRPMLFQAIKDGQMSPYEFALIENWKIASESNHNKASYGFLGPTLDQKTAKIANDLRVQIGLRHIELRNDLIDIQTKYGIDLYLPGSPWQDGKIAIDINN